MGEEGGGERERDKGARAGWWLIDDLPNPCATESNHNFISMEASILLRSVNDGATADDPQPWKRKRGNGVSGVLDCAARHQHSISTQCLCQGFLTIVAEWNQTEKPARGVEASGSRFAANAALIVY